MKRKAPEDGYLRHGEKAQYRRSVWRAFRDFTGARTALSNVLLMPSIEGHEIETALAVGYRESNLYVVDRNPAIVAHLKRRWSRINTYGVDITMAAKRIASQGVQIHAANLDFCGTSESGSIDAQSVLESGAMAGEHIMAITALRGRERGHIKACCDEFGWANANTARVAELLIAFFATKHWFDVVKGFQYKSTAGSQTMMVLIVHAISHEHHSAAIAAALEYIQTAKSRDLIRIRSKEFDRHAALFKRAVSCYEQYERYIGWLLWARDGNIHEAAQKALSAAASGRVDEVHEHATSAVADVFSGAPMTRSEPMRMSFTAP